MRIEVFSADSEIDLEERVNNWLSRNKHVQIVDIKFSSSSVVIIDGSITTTFSAMIMYK